MDHKREHRTPPLARVMGVGRQQQHGICTAKPTFDMIGPLHVDVFNQSKYMLNGETMKVRMTRSKDSFVLMARSDVRVLQSKHIIGKFICEKIENHTKSLPGTRTHSPTKDDKVSYNARGV